MSQSLFISHGGGPLPLLNDPSHAELTRALKDLAQIINRPKLILIVSAHWEASTPTITSVLHPSLLFDYSGFPPESYEIKYPVLGAPEHAERLTKELRQFGFRPKHDAERGLDHGVFVPLKIMYPEADIPVLQISLIKGLDPEIHLTLGEAIRQYADQEEGVLLIGSGFSFHNMRAFFSASTPQTRLQNESFEDWLEQVCASRMLSYEERRDHLINWESAPYARYCHPREEHLIPLHVCVGFARSAATKTTHVKVLNHSSSMFYWA